MQPLENISLLVYEYVSISAHATNGTSKMPHCKVKQWLTDAEH